MKRPKTEETRWYEEHLRPHESMIRAWLNSRYGEQIDVDDVIQEALMRVFKARKKREVNAPKAFFFATARNIAVDVTRKRSKVTAVGDFSESEMLELLDDGVSIEETVARNHELELLTQAIQSLPERCRGVFTLSKVYGMTYNEITKEMGISFNTVAAHISVGLSKCTKFMHRYGRDK